MLAGSDLPESGAGRRADVAGGDAVGHVLHDEEHLAGLRRRLDRVAVRTRADDADGPAAGRRSAVDEREARVGELSNRVASRVVLRVHVAGLDLRDQVARVGLGRGILGLLALAEERGKSDGGKDADDENDDQKLDQGETLLTLSALAELVEHVD